MIEYTSNRGCIFIKTFNYTYNYNPSIYDYIMSTMILNERKQEKKILSLLVKGKTCAEIADEVGYCERTIQTRRKDIYEKTKDLMV